MLPIIAAAVGYVGTWFTRRQEIKAEEHKAKTQLIKASADAKSERMKTGQEGDIAWENTSIGQSGWRDEYLTIIISIPAILCFIPGCDIYVVNGFAALAGCPVWYQWLFLCSAGSAFGIKELTKFMNVKKGF